MNLRKIPQNNESGRPFGGGLFTVNLEKSEQYQSLKGGGAPRAKLLIMHAFIVLASQIESRYKESSARRSYHETRCDF